MIKKRKIFFCET